MHKNIKQYNFQHWLKQIIKQQISILEWLLKNQCNAKDWKNGCWKFSFAMTGMNYILKYIDRKLALIVVIFHTIAVLLYFDNIYTVLESLLF